MQRLAAVTGGTGFVGRYCVAALVQAGYRVRMLARRETEPAAEVEVVAGDLADAGRLSRLVHGADVVVHLAGLVQARTRRDFDAVNRAGSARLAAVVAHDAPMARCILVSSMAAREPGLSHYAASKRAGEAAAVALLGATPWVILRPGVIYGPWDMAGTALLRLAAGRLFPVPAPPEPRIAMVHARDVAAALVAVCAADAPAGVVYELSDACTEGYGWREIALSAASMQGRRPRFVRVPDFAVLAAGALSDAFRLPGSVFGLGKAREILHRTWGAEPGSQPPAAVWLPRIGLAEGMRETVDWWRAEGSRR